MKKLLLILFLLGNLVAKASHIKAGEITYQKLSGLTYEVTLETYSENGNLQSQLADQPTAIIYWGDGTSSVVNRASRVNLPYTTWESIYKAKHTYASAGLFQVAFSSANRIDAISNMDNSFNTPFFVESSIVIRTSVSVNTSPVMSAPAVALASAGHPFSYDLLAADADGDSLVFSLKPTLQAHAMDAYGYILPAATSGFISIDAHTGVLSWLNPVMAGLYSIGVETKEYRNGVLLGTVFRDMLITVDNGTGMQQAKTGDVFTIYPNPAAGTYQIQSSGWADKELQFMVCDVSGRMILTKTIMPLSGEIHLTESLGLPKGIYLVKLMQENKTAQSKLLVQ